MDMMKKIQGIMRDRVVGIAGANGCSASVNFHEVRPIIHHCFALSLASARIFIGLCVCLCVCVYLIARRNLHDMLR